MNSFGGQPGSICRAEEMILITRLFESVVRVGMKSAVLSLSNQLSFLSGGTRILHVAVGPERGDELLLQQPGTIPHQSPQGWPELGQG